MPNQNYPYQPAEPEIRPGYVLLAALAFLAVVLFCSCQATGLDVQTRAAGGTSGTTERRLAVGFGQPQTDASIRLGLTRWSGRGGATATGGRVALRAPIGEGWPGALPIPYYELGLGVRAFDQDTHAFVAGSIGMLVPISHGAQATLSLEQESGVAGGTAVVIGLGWSL